MGLSNTFKLPERVTKEEAEDAVRVLLRWAGEDPKREGLIDTSSRYVKVFKEWFAGYENDSVEILSRMFDELEGYDEMVVLHNVRFESHCEHHIAPIIGNAHVAYLPDKRVVRVSKLARLVDLYSKRLQIRKRLTAQIATILKNVLQPKGVGVVVEASNGCMTTRGVEQTGLTMVTSQMIGAFREDSATRREFLAAIGNPTSGPGNTI
ncbi:MAG: GTP cyclohydrolase I FolE [Pseudomonadota bacterium]|nr:GTP cyclohydrolase I FolE [Pseudomonadota bacterium]